MGALFSEPDDHFQDLSEKTGCKCGLTAIINAGLCVHVLYEVRKLLPRVFFPLCTVNPDMAHYREETSAFRCSAPGHPEYKIIFRIKFYIYIFLHMALNLSTKKKKRNWTCFM